MGRGLGRSDVGRSVLLAARGIGDVLVVPALVAEEGGGEQAGPEQDGEEHAEDGRHDHVEAERLVAQM